MWINCEYIDICPPFWASFPCPFFLVYLFICLFFGYMACRILVPCAGMKPVLLAVGVESQPLDHQRTPSKCFNTRWRYQISGWPKAKNRLYLRLLKQCLNRTQVEGRPEWSKWNVKKHHELGTDVKSCAYQSSVWCTNVGALVWQSPMTMVCPRMSHPRGPSFSGVDQEGPKGSPGRSEDLGSLRTLAI